MSLSTVYDVRVRYSVDNRAGRAVDGLVKDTRQLGNEVKRSTGLFGRLGVAVAAAFGARQAGKALIGFNSTVEDTKNQIAGMLALTKKTDLSDQLKNADRLFGNLQKRAATLPGTTMEYARMAGMLTQPIIDAGMTMKDLENITINTVVGAKALGVEWQAAARDIDQALRGQFHSTDVFTGKLLGSVGYKGEEGRAKFNAMSAGKRGEELNRAMQQKQITQLAAAQGNTFSGALSTLQDTVDQFLGKVGKPLFGVITAELKEWNKWIAANGDKLEDIAKTVGGKLVDGFRFIKDTLGFLVGHADTLIMIGKAWATVKVAGMLGGALGGKGGLIGGAGSGVSSFANWFRKDKDGYDEDGGYKTIKGGAGQQAVKGIGGIVGNLGMISSAGAAGYAIGNMLGLDKVGTGIGASLAMLTGRTDKATAAMERAAKEMDHLKESTRKAFAKTPGVAGAVGMRQGLADDYQSKANLVSALMAAQTRLNANPMDGGARDHYSEVLELAKAAGIETNGDRQGYMDAMQAKATAMSNQTVGIGAIGAGALVIGMQGLTEYQRKTLDVAKAQNEIMTYLTQQITQGKVFDPMHVMELLRGSTDDPKGTHKKVAEKAKVNVTIQRIEVQSDDPDRMAFGLLESFRDAAKNPSSALSALREG